MLKTFTAALIAASMLTAPAFAQGVTPAKPAPVVQPAKGADVKASAVKPADTKAVETKAVETKTSDVKGATKTVKAGKKAHKVKKHSASEKHAAPASIKPAQAVQTTGSAPKTGSN